MKFKMFMSLFFAASVAGSALSASASTDKQLASCLLNIAPNLNYCTVHLDQSDAVQKELGQAIRKTMGEGSTYNIVLMDKEGNRYENWDDYYAATNGIAYAHVYYHSESKYSISTGMNGVDISKDRRDNDFRYAIDSLIKNLLSE